MTNILIEGWRFLPHSYAVVNQFQILELLTRSELQIFHQDMPYPNPEWESVTGLFSHGQEELLASLSPLPANEEPAATLRMASPHDLSPKSGKVFVFMTSEYGYVAPSALNLPLALLDPSVTIITCSQWAKQGILNSGAPEKQVFVVSLGIDPEVFHPLQEDKRAELRSGLGIAPDEFVFFNAGAMTGNKGIQLLLKAFVSIVKANPKAKLFLKGMDALYSSHAILESVSRILSQEELDLIAPRIAYFGGTLPFFQMAQLYQACDGYVSPYHAEGFNLPVLEAAACGLPVICTRGGSCTDFTDPSFCREIDSTLENITTDHGTGYLLRPSIEHLISLMLEFMEDGQFRKEASKCGPEFARSRFTWKHSVDKLLEVIKTRCAA